MTLIKIREGRVRKAQYLYVAQMRSIESVLIFLDAAAAEERLVMVAQGANLAPCLASLSEDNKNYSQWDRILEPKSYACNCQTPGAFDRFFMPFDVTFEKSRVRMAIIGTSQLQQQDSKRSTSPNSSSTATYWEK